MRGCIDVWKSLTAATGVASSVCFVHEAITMIDEGESLTQEAKNDEEETNHALDPHDDGVSWTLLDVISGWIHRVGCEV